MLEGHLNPPYECYDYEAELEAEGRDLKDELEAYADDLWDEFQNGERSMASARSAYYAARARLGVRRSFLR